MRGDEHAQVITHAAGRHIATVPMRYGRRMTPAESASGVKTLWISWASMTLAPRSSMPSMVETTSRLRVRSDRAATNGPDKVAILAKARVEEAIFLDVGLVEPEHDQSREAEAERKDHLPRRPGVRVRRKRET